MNRPNGASGSTPTATQAKPARRGRRRKGPVTCHCCTGTFTFCWQCRCGFAICQACMHENVWGMSCNHITWQCPDCGQMNGFGNQ